MRFRAKKSLGQNFLIDENILNKITNTAKIKGLEILEVGPGTGNLTEQILNKEPKKIYVVEKDRDLSLLLNEKFGDNIIMINDDILKINEKKISKNKLIVFGNLPYNISTEILSKWITNLNNHFWFSKLVLMFQKEVADRIIAKENTSDYGRLSILTNWKLNVEKILDIKPVSFSPRPKIDSTLLTFSPKLDFPKIKDVKNLELVTRVFFNQRRKMIKKPFNQLFSNAYEVSEKLNIDLNLRPQNLSPTIYLNITREYEKLRS
ncbi:16S rRNA (adenine(1518)-N(6)/adenine(1519)-N(6))-dimethyltransferase RsmA [Candidatus Pelagibacter sp.]|nr:16S rRNA (adenine(1518)-N(6)/adenine(1519)-N(6))-dimethyltransferase RsmA [Candidatus Pelagibacter sp.]MDA9663442.1 16S rRNA (adenine(1518)-N(6)/adenine(1519)-N(6))-dimethyltransferase RsmA [Candidatus Pelagibacter sp.]